MFLFNHTTTGEWKADFTTESGEAKPLAKPQIDKSLLELVGCENLIVLTGLGTSLHVTDFLGDKLAPTMWDLWEAAKAAVGDLNFNQILDDVNYHPEEGQENIEILLSNCKLANDFLPEGDVTDRVTAFVVATEKLIHEKCSFLEPDLDLDVHSDFLCRIARRSNRKIRTKIFTTNYDKCFEQAGNHNGYVVVDGFSHSLPQSFDSAYFEYDVVRRDGYSEVSDYIENVFHLYKLHGSVDWERTSSGRILKLENTHKPIMVYPRHNKYELAFEPPYLEMMSAFQAALRKPNTGLLVVGFGFNDNHLSEPIVSAIRSNLNFKLVVCDPSLKPHCEGAPFGKDTVSNNPYLKQLKKLVELGDPRISFINSTFEEIVPVIPDMVAQDEREKHLHRVQLMQADIQE
jgi:hypothetical protein